MLGRNARECPLNVSALQHAFCFCLKNLLSSCDIWHKDYLHYRNEENGEGVGGGCILRSFLEILREFCKKLDKNNY